MTTTRAEALDALVLTSPAAARRRAERLAAAGDARQRAEALRIAGLAGKELGELDTALAELREAVHIAQRAGLRYLAARSRLSLVGVLTEHGDLDAALREADAAAGALHGADAARLTGHRALIASRCGRFAEAVRLGETALAGLAGSRDAGFVAGLANNVGLARAYRGDLRRAEADLHRCIRIAEDTALTRLAAMGRANLAFTARLAGDLPRALRGYQRAETEFAGAGGRAAFIAVDRAATLLSAGLATEALAALRGVPDALAAQGSGAQAAEARLLRAEAALATGDPVTARRAAARAYRAFATQGRDGWVPLAELTGLRAAFAAGERTHGLAAACWAAAAALAARGWAEPAARARTLAARISLDLGDGATVRTELGRLPPPPRCAPDGERVAYWHACALARIAAGNGRGAAAALRAGVRAVERGVAPLVAADLRAHGAAHAVELIDLGLFLARQRRSARMVLRWAERMRAIAAPPPVRPPSDPALAAALTELRSATAQADEWLAGGRGASAIARRRGAAEDRVRRLGRVRAGAPGAAGTAGRFSRADLPALAAELGGRALVEYLVSGGALLAVTAADRRYRLHELGDYRTRAAEVAALTFQAHRLALYGAAGGDESTGRGIDAAAATVRRALLDPLRGAVGDRDLVVVPARGLHAVPWAALPGMAGRPLTVAPSAAAWRLARRTAGSAPRAGTRGRAVLVAGPDVPHAVAEIDQVAACHHDPVVLTGSAARTDRLLPRLAGAPVLHVSAHADYRPGNAQFSAITLADGPMFGYDLEAVPAAPGLVVLSACEAGRADIASGEAMLGLAATFLARGAGNVVASVAPVHDGQTAAFMAAFHARLASGATPARALAAAPRTPGVLGFVCLGAG